VAVGRSLEMDIRNIVNRDIVNLQNCESEPIHIPGSIQPHGILIAFNQVDNTVSFCSANTNQYLSLQPQQVLGKTLAGLFGENEAQKIEHYLAVEQSGNANPHIINFDGVEYNTVVTRSNSTIVLELEPFPDGSLKLPDLYRQTKRFVGFLQTANSLVELSQNIANDIKHITGYDRVMIYRFDKDYNGEVIAESCNDNLEPFLGLNYPHTDIPPQARQLYLSNQMRIIVDVNYKPVPVVTTNTTADNSSLDLSNAVLRSVSPIHIQYLQNMGVGGTLTISLIHDNRLWGLVACHHYSAKNVPYYTRLAALLQGHFLTSQIKVREVADEYALSQIIEERLQNLIKVIGKGANKIVEAEQLEYVKGLTNATGLAIIISGKVYCTGATPNIKEITALADWLNTNQEYGQLATSYLASVYSRGEAIAENAAGVIYHSLGAVEKDCIIWFRQEVEKSINWAGDPAKAVVKDANGLSPRKSFQLWKETVKMHSPDWRKAELNAAASFANALQKQLHVYHLSTQENKYRTLSEKLQVANNELANINWISTHDLKEPLRKISIFASRILRDEGLDENVKDSVGRMQKAALRMQALIEDILSYSRVNDMQNAFEDVDLQKVVADILNEYEEEITERKAVFSISILPVVKGIPFQLQQLFTNVIGNALKFIGPGKVPDIQITCSKIRGSKSGVNELANETEYYKLSVTDNGIGFDAKYSNQIFQVFQRLNNTVEYNGTGIGLAICKKIAENHSGTITAEGEHGKGATFNIYLPV